MTDFPIEEQAIRVYAKDVSVTPVVAAVTDAPVIAAVTDAEQITTDVNVTKAHVPDETAVDDPEALPCSHPKKFYHSTKNCLSSPPPPMMLLLPCVPIIPD